MKKLFIMFQGSGMNLKDWNEYTKSKFLDRLKELGTVYTYQDKVNNVWHYSTWKAIMLLILILILILI
jgi:hypothetical protein